MSRSIIRVIKKRAKPYPITRFDRIDGTYDDEDGIYQGGGDDEIEFVKIHKQPIVDRISDGLEAQRSLAQFHGWSIEQIKNKDVVQIGEELFTVNELKEWDVYREFDLTRSGELENLAEA